MNIFLYWNYKDQDSKKIYQFLNNTSFRASLEASHNVVFHREFHDFPLDDRLLNEIADSDLVLFFTHGDDDAILKFRYNDESVKKRFTFVDLENASVLKNKKVLAFCCRSANILGRYCVDKDIESKFFVGFSDDLIYSENFSVDFKNIVYKTYSNAFEKTLIDACNKNWSADKFVLMLRKNILDLLTKEILASQDRKLGSFSGVSFHTRTANSLVALGHSAQLIFE